MVEELYIDAIKKLLVRINAKHQPQVVVVHPLPEAVAKNCFNNVQRHVFKSGGEVIYGWSICVSPFMVEAEKHAVWKTQEGIFIDITPRIPIVSSTLFVRDDDFIYTGQYVDNIRLNVTENPVVDDWIKICEGIETLFTYGRRKDEFEIIMPENIVPFLRHLEDLKVKYGDFLNARGHPNTRCFCGRQLPYNECHGTDMENLQIGLEKVAVIFKSEASYSKI